MDDTSGIAFKDSANAIGTSTKRTMRTIHKAVISMALVFGLPLISTAAEQPKVAERKQQAARQAAGRMTAERLLQADGLMVEYAIETTRHCSTPMEVAKQLLKELKKYKRNHNVMTAQQVFYLKEGDCNTLSYLFVTLFNKRMEAAGSSARAYLCEVYRNRRFYEIPHTAVRVEDGNDRFVIESDLGKLHITNTEPIPHKVIRNPLSSYYVDLAFEAFRKGDSPAAEKHAREAVRLGPDSAFAHFVLSLVLSKTGKLEEARKEAERTIEIAPVWPSGYCMLEIILSELGLKEKKDAIREKLEKLVYSNPSYEEYEDEFEKYLKAAGYNVDDFRCLYGNDARRNR